jgi:nucleoside-diphosphate-sugar epimerase
VSQRILVTGASGFVGRVLCNSLAQAGHTVRAAVRAGSRVPTEVAETVDVGDIHSSTVWDAAVRDIDVVIHLAARAHVLHDEPANAPLYLSVNALGSRRLATCASAAGVRRFVFLSSVKVNGEESTAAYTSGDFPRPADPYAESKRLGEEAVREVASRGAMQCSIVRPPLVYGPGVRANFLRLLQWVEQGVPLPLGSVRNRRSLVSVWNLCDLLRHLVDARIDGSRTWMVSDGEDLSTPDLIRRIAMAMGRKPRLVPVPVSALRLIGALTGRTGEVNRVCGSLVVDSTPARRELNWTPPCTLDDGLVRTVRWFMNSRGAFGDSRGKQEK